jgi:hypothetical protein
MCFGPLRPRDYYCLDARRLIKLAYLHLCLTAKTHHRPPKPRVLYVTPDKHSLRPYLTGAIRLLLGSTS